MKKKEIQIKCKGNRYVNWKELKPFQGNLKELSPQNFKKLKQSIINLGWISPCFVWDKNKTLDGHGRLLVLPEIEKEGYVIPPLPVVDIQAPDKRTAGKILLAINSRYQRITQEGLDEFIKNNDIDFNELDDIDIPEFSIEEFLKDMKNEVIEPSFNG